MMSSPDHDLASPGESPVSSPSLAVLQVDDDPGFLKLCQIILQEQHISVTPATSVREAFSLLASREFDVIISDYIMPEMDGIGFLKLLQQRGCRIPFILFTGKGREEMLIEALDNGAASYIQKSGDCQSLFAELAHDVLEVSRKYRAEEALKETRLRYSTLFEYSGPAIVTLEDDLLISRANTSFANLTGYRISEIEGHLRCPDLIPDEDAVMLTGHIRRLREGSIPPAFPITFRLITKDRQVRFVSGTVAIIPGNVLSILSLTEIPGSSCSGAPADHGLTIRPGNAPAAGSDLARPPRKEFTPWMIQNRNPRV
jgi:PAS domain S-box-containing protein